MTRSPAFPSESPNTGWPVFRSDVTDAEPVTSSVAPGASVPLKP
jgi:hypothetical protein